MTDHRRLLPSVGQLLEEPRIAALLDHAPRSAVIAAVRSTIASARRGRAPLPESWSDEVRERLVAEAGSSLRPVINATGVVLHTNLGRAPLAASAVEAIAQVAAGYSTLELDLHSGVRGDRTDHGRTRLAELTGAADGLAVNNGAGALVLALNACAEGRDVAVSRGELIEIGGSFRIPDILVRSGARLREIGTTNRTHLADYESAIRDGASAILIVHRSNFTQQGFVSTPAPHEVVALAARAGIPVVYDVGGGLATDLSRFGLVGEPLVQEAVASGADLVAFSGDKLLGGPQAGILVGSAAAIASCRRNPLARAFRADKLTLAALDATLALYAEPETVLDRIPVLAMLSAPPALLQARAERLAARCPPSLSAKLLPGCSAVGGGAFPEARLPTTLIALDPGELGADG
ncbi:MAG TPA: L-seryl-tRNA(Sec) selenium transferase, partial [Gemmatimonadales bacterium]|nr:L-seryl-tRNA(Sec) selenium transferase [Gemmatimonadales bacterium]